MTAATSRLDWHELHFSRPLDPAAVARCLRAWAADTRSPLVVLEARGSAGRITLALGAAAVSAAAVLPALRTASVRVTAMSRPRLACSQALSLRASTRHRPLSTSDVTGVVQALLAALARTQRDETLVLQLMLGPRRIPLAVSQHSPSSLVAPWYAVAWHGKGGQLDGEKRAALRSKVADYGFACTVRLGAVAGSPARRRSLILSLLSALRLAQAPGVTLSLRRESARRLNQAAPPLRWPLRLGVAELVPLTGWPVGDDDLPGMPALHPTLLPPPPGTTGTRRVVARASAPLHEGDTLAIGVEAALRHVLVTGPTGTGKSTLLANLIMQDIADGRGVVVIEPRGDLVDDILARIPEHRASDLVVIDPQDAAPVGLNPLHRGARRPDLVADGVLSIFKGLYGPAIGPRSQDILYAGLLTLAQRDDASLVMLPLLLTNPGFRRSMTAGLRDPLSLEPFWAAYDNWSEAERATAIAPVMNKLRPLLRPGLRDVLGQRRPRFDLRQVFTERKVLLVPLRRGVVGPDVARLLGALVMADLWQAIQGRSAVPQDRRHPVMVVLDEAQDYLHLSTDLGEALAQARGYGVGFTMAHQLLAQLPLELRAAVLTNARSRVIFQVSPEDAVQFAKGHPELTALDFSALGRHEVYASIYADGRVTPYASGVTLPLAAPSASPARIRAASQARYGRPLDEIEADFAALVGGDPTTVLGAAAAGLGTTGRRRRPS